MKFLNTTILNRLPLCLSPFVRCGCLLVVVDGQNDTHTNTIILCRWFFCLPSLFVRRFILVLEERLVYAIFALLLGTGNVRLIHFLTHRFTDAHLNETTHHRHESKEVKSHHDGANSGPLSPTQRRTALHSSCRSRLPRTIDKF